MDNDVLAVIVIAAFFFFIGIVSGFGLAREGITKDCQVLQQFRDSNIVFDCKERSK